MASKTDNAYLTDKLALRRKLINQYTSPGFTVMDCCAGSGQIWGELRNEYECRYWGIDVKRKNGRLKAQSERILEAGATADVIDVDTYGSPWKHWFALLPHLTGQTLVFLTVGSTHTGNQQSIALDAAGLNFRELRCPPTLSAKFRQVITRYCLARAHKYGLTIDDGRVIHHERVEYYGLVLENRHK